MIGSTQSHLELGLVAQSQDLLFVAEIGKIALVPRRPEVRLCTDEKRIFGDLPSRTEHLRQKLTDEERLRWTFEGDSFSLELTFNIKDADGA